MAKKRIFNEIPKITRGNSEHLVNSKNFAQKLNKAVIITNQSISQPKSNLGKSCNCGEYMRILELMGILNENIN